MNDNTPDFASWHHGTLVLFATEAFIKMQDQRALIQQLRQLIANGVWGGSVIEPERSTHHSKHVHGNPSMSKPLEKQIERSVCDYAHEAGLLVYKFTSPARAAVPDRMFVTPKGTVFFVEFKREGQKPTPQQTREHDRLRGHGVMVFVVDSVKAGRLIVDMMREQ